MPLRSCWICSYSTRQNQSFMRKRLNCDMSICKWYKNSRGHSSGYLNVQIKDSSYIWLYIDWLVGVERQLSNIYFSYIVAFCLYSISTRSCMLSFSFICLRQNSYCRDIEITSAISEQLLSLDNFEISSVTFFILFLLNTSNPLNKRIINYVCFKIYKVYRHYYFIFNICWLNHRTFGLLFCIWFL